MLNKARWKSIQQECCMFSFTSNETQQQWTIKQKFNSPKNPDPCLLIESFYFTLMKKNINYEFIRI